MVQVLLGVRTIHLDPHIAPDTYALASATVSLAAAAQHMATVGGVCTAVLVAYYGWIVDYQHGMMPTLLLFEPRRLAILPLTPIDGLRGYLPHLWIANWMRLPENLQFITYFWPRADGRTGSEGTQTIAIFAFAAAAAACAYLAGPTTRAED